METAMPFPRVVVMRVAAADRDRTGEHVTIVDVPAFLTGIGRSAAGEFGHSPSNCGIEGVGKPSYSLGLKIRGGKAINRKPMKAGTSPVFRPKHPSRYQRPCKPFPLCVQI
jgi:hypothetical protein